MIGRVLKVIAASLLVLSVVGCSGLMGTDEVIDDSRQTNLADIPAEAQEFVSLVNDYRESEGLEPLVWDTALASVAVAHSEDMRDRNFFSHDNPDGEDPFDRMRAAGISFQRAGENIASGYRTGQAVLDGWLASEGHRTNIETAAYTHHGLGYVEEGHYWTHVFATIPSVE